MARDRYVSTTEAAKRLGVKPQTLYAYVSRGLLESHPSPDGRSSRFSLDDVERLAGRGRRNRSSPSRPTAITSAITQLDERRGPRYRGLAATELAASATFEQVTELVWRGREAFAAAPATWPAPVPPARPPLEGAAAADVLRAAVVADGARRSARFDRRPAMVAAAARHLLGAMVSALPVRSGPPPTLKLDRPPAIAGSLAAELCTRLVCRRPTAALAGAVNTALVLLADHELATAAVAARVAASTHADVHNAVLAGLGALAGPLHGSASTMAIDLLSRAHREGAETAVEQSLRWQARLAGFGHTVYPGADPRFPALLAQVERLPAAARRATVADVLAAAERRNLPPPNVDFGLAALAFVAAMPSDAGEVIFTIARVSGLVAHVIEEYDEEPLRFRARAIYLSP